MTRTEICSQAVGILQDYLDENIPSAKRELIIETIQQLMSISGMQRLCSTCEQIVIFSCPYCGAIDE